MDLGSQYNVYVQTKTTRQLPSRSRDRADLSCFSIYFLANDLRNRRVSQSRALLVRPPAGELPGEFIFFFHFSVLTVPCGRLSWLSQLFTAR